jgi:hypothetical protein
VTPPEIETLIRDARASVLTIWNQTTEPATKTLADDVYKKLSSLLRALPHEAS